MTRPRALRDFEEALAAAQALLDDRPGAPARHRTPHRPPPSEVVAQPLPSLLAQCRALLSETAARPAPVRCVHHMACTGGTVIARCIGALPNTRVLSEVDPLSTQDPAPEAFFPTDLIRLARAGTRPPGRAVLIEMFQQGLVALQRDSRAQGLDLVLRDHAHSHFCHGAAIPDRPALREIVAAVQPLRGVVTVRHPLQSWLSLQAAGWIHFTPPEPGEYARRYHAFLDRHDDLPRIRYEDFVDDPDAQMARICAALELRHDPGFRQRLAAVRLSGNSGRGGDIIRPRPPRPVPPALHRAAGACADFTGLLARLGYAMP